MSFPNIPDITPKIDISFEDSINLILTSIAMEEMSLSRLLDAEKCKVCCVLNDCKGKESLLHNAVAINKSVNETVQNIIKLQMLLQFKLENVKDMLPCTTTTYSSTTSTSTTTTFTQTSTHTTTCSSSCCPTTTQAPCCCCFLKGKGVGVAQDCCDDFYNKRAFLQVYICAANPKNGTLRYTVGTACDNLTVTSSHYNLVIDCPTCPANDHITVSGRCHIERRFKDCPYEVGTGVFRLTVKKLKYGKLGFIMEVTSKCNPKLNHISGLVTANVYDSNLVMQA